MQQILNSDTVIQTQLKLDHGSASYLLFASEGWYDLCKDVML